MSEFNMLVTNLGGKEAETIKPLQGRLSLLLAERKDEGRGEET